MIIRQPEYSISDLKKDLQTTLDVNTNYDVFLYPSGLKRIVIKGNSKRNLNPQAITTESNTFTTISRNFYELYDIEFVELDVID